MDALQFFGYSASIVIAVSMTQSSIVKFRWINLVGASSFLIYGFLIGAIPVVILNTFILSVDIFYLFRIYNKKELFQTLEVRGDNKYLLNFLKFYESDIRKIIPGFEYKPELNTISFFILRNMSVAGIFLAHKEDEDTLRVGLDFVIPQYRDYKNGKYIYHRLRESFIKDGFNKVLTCGFSDMHVNYLKKIGFKKNESGMYFKILEK